MILQRWQRYLLCLLLVAAAAFASILGYGIWQIAFHVPDNDPTPLPAQLIALHSPQGEALLASSAYKADYQALNDNFESQSRAAYCGVASSVIVLNAMHHVTHQSNQLAPTALQQSPITQQSFFTDDVRRVMEPFDVAFGGMTLDQNGALWKARGMDVTVTHAADSTLDKFRNVVEKNLATADDYLLVNYSRKPLGEDGGGHFSPLAAYDAASDKVLIMDVTAYNYPPTWVPMTLMWNGMNTIDGSSGKTRGFIEVRMK